MRDAIHIDIDHVAVEGLNQTEQAHVDGCAACSEALASVRAEFAQLRTIDETLENVPASFWVAQRRAIRVRAQEAKPKSVFTGAYAWAGAAAAALIVAGSLLLPDSQDRPVTPTAQSTEEISDAALLQSVQDHLETYPEALHPAQVMYTEMAASAKGLRQQGNKR
jgi:hypothetical protein